MIPTTPTHSHVGIYRIDAAEAAEAWTGAPPGLRGSPLVDRDSLRVTHWTPIGARLTKDQVLHPTSQALAEEERARLRMGDRVLRGGTEKLGAG
jgi:hypothetical protein